MDAKVSDYVLIATVVSSSGKYCTEWISSILFALYVSQFYATEVYFKMILNNS